jgi:hypothetical protein
MNVMYVGTTYSCGTHECNKNVSSANHEQYCSLCSLELERLPSRAPLEADRHTTMRARGGLVKTPHRTAAWCVVAWEPARRRMFSEIRFRF